jgi:hypothetical protein
LGVSVWFFQFTGRDQYTTSLTLALVLWSIAWSIRSVLTAGIAQIIASTARLSMSRLFRSLAGEVCAKVGPATSKMVTAAKAVFTTTSELQNGLM